MAYDNFQHLLALMMLHRQPNLARICLSPKKVLIEIAIAIEIEIEIGSIGEPFDNDPDPDPDPDPDFDFDLDRARPVLDVRSLTHLHRCWHYKDL
jgi:hypothetical protein